MRSYDYEPMGKVEFVWSIFLAAIAMSCIAMPIYTFTELMGSQQQGRWTLGILIGLPVIVFLVLFLFGIAVLLGTLAHYDHSPNFYWGTVVELIVMCGLGLGAGFGYWPWSGEYHQYRTVSGNVDTVSSRLVSAGDKGGSNQKFVVTLQGGNQQYGITDTRAALLKSGSHVVLKCKRSYEYGSNDAGYDCKWGQ